MFNPKPASDVYTSCLRTLGHGHALWVPEPHQCDEVRPGDVGYYYGGAFIRLFNARLPADHPSNSVYGVPTGFKPLEIPESLICVVDKYFDPGTLRSCNILETKFGVSADGCPIPGGAGIQFTCGDKQGAVLFLTRRGVREDILALDLCKSYAKDNYQSWYDFANRQLGLGVKNGEIVFVTGCDKTAEWASAAFNEKSRGIGISFYGGFPLAGGAEITLSGTWQTSTSVQHRSGPLCEAGDVKYNQTIFVRSYKLKESITGAPKIIRAASEPRDDFPSQPGEGDLAAPAVDDMETDEEEEQEDDIPPFNALDALADHILENSNATLAIVHDNDLNAEFVEGVGDSVAIKEIVQRYEDQFFAQQQGQEDGSDCPVIVDEILQDPVTRFDTENAPNCREEMDSHSPKLVPEPNLSFCDLWGICLTCGRYCDDGTPYCSTACRLVDVSHSLFPSTSSALDVSQFRIPPPHKLSSFMDIDSCVPSSATLCEYSDTTAIPDAAEFTIEFAESSSPYYGLQDVDSTGDPRSQPPRLGQQSNPSAFHRRPALNQSSRRGYRYVAPQRSFDVPGHGNNCDLDSALHGQRLPRAREDLVNKLKTVQAWIDSTMSDSHPTIWASNDAGVGKSAIAKSVAKSIRPPASCFLSSCEGENRRGRKTSPVARRAAAEFTSQERSHRQSSLHLSEEAMRYDSDNWRGSLVDAAGQLGHPGVRRSRPRGQRNSRSSSPRSAEARAKLYSDGTTRRATERKASFVGDTHIGSRLPHGDAATIQKFIEDAYGYQDCNIAVLPGLDEAESRCLAPTKENIMKNIADFVQDSLPGDNLIFLYSGHGDELSGTNQPFTEVYTRGTDLGSILDDELEGALCEAPCSGATLVAVLDACHSGTLLDLPNSLRDICRRRSQGIRRPVSSRSSSRSPPPPEERSRLYMDRKNRLDDLRPWFFGESSCFTVSAMPHGSDGYPPPFTPRHLAPESPSNLQFNRAPNYDVKFSNISCRKPTLSLESDRHVMRTSGLLDQVREGDSYRPCPPQAAACDRVKQWVSIDKTGRLLQQEPSCFVDGSVMRAEHGFAKTG